jgi:hypothetical protein
MRIRARFATMTAVALLVGGCGWFGPSHEPDIAAGPDVVDAPFACPVIGPDYVATPGAKDLPDGARAARICLSDEPDAWIPPRDALTSNVDELVQVVNRQRITGVAHPGPRDPGNVGCGGPTPPSFAIVFRYPDGTRTISGNPVLCSAIALQVGNAVRAHPMRAWHAYFRLLAAQRQSEEPPSLRRSNARCPGPSRRYVVSPVFDVRRLSGARVCSTNRRGELHDQGEMVPPGRLRQLAIELLTAPSHHVGRGGPGCATWPASDHYVVSVRDTWGDRALLYGKCASYFRDAPIPGLTMIEVRPRPATIRLFVRLLKS